MKGAAWAGLVPGCLCPVCSWSAAPSLAVYSVWGPHVLLDMRPRSCQCHTSCNELPDWLQANGGLMRLCRSIKPLQWTSVQHFQKCWEEGLPSSPLGCMSRSPRPKSSSHTFHVDNPFHDLVQGKDHGLWSPEFKSEFGNLVQCALVSDSQDLPI